MILVVIGAGHSRARDLGTQVHYYHSGDPQVMDESLRGLVLLPSVLYGTWQCSVQYTAIALKTGSGQYVRGISLAMLASQCTFISGSVSVAIACLWLLLTASRWQ